jgi:translation initiation factor IF-2
VGRREYFRAVSARTGQGVDQLLDSILLQAEVLELKAPTEGYAAGFVIESSLEKGRGAVATVLVLRGTLKLGDAILLGQEFGRVRALFDEAGRPVESAGPSIPVVVLGLSGAPNAGDEMLVVESERKAREVAMHRQAKSRDVKLAKQSANMQDVFSNMGESKPNVVQLLVKADVQGSVEALARCAQRTVDRRSRGQRGGERRGRAHRIGHHAGRGVQGADHRIQRARRCRGARRDQGARRRRSLLQHHLRGDRRHPRGADRHARARGQGADRRPRAVRSVFRSSKFGTVAGCMVIDGYVRRNFPIRVLRTTW